MFWFHTHENGHHAHGQIDQIPENAAGFASKFEIFLRYKEHTDARKASYFPGAELVEDKTVAFTCTDWMDALRLFLFTV